MRISEWSQTCALPILLGYVEETQKSALPHLTGMAVESASETIALDAATRRNLELDTHPSGRTEHTLLGVLDETVTPMGARLLRRWLTRPLRSRDVLRQRHQAIGTLIDSRRHESLREQLRGIGDRSEEHTSELQSLMRISYAVFCLKKKQ